MLNMQKTHDDSNFSVFEKDSIWYDCVFNPRKYNREKPISPQKHDYNDFSNCDEIRILQMQCDDKKYMIEYVII